MKDAKFSADHLLALYDRVAEAEDAIPRLRRFVLDLAVRGKLVEQDPSDEPAAELLKRIAQEKARLVKAGEIKKSEVDGLLPSDEPFALPKNWAWTRLGSIGDWGAGSTPSRGNSELYGGSVTWLKSGELNDNTALAGSEETVTEAAVKKGSFRVNKPGDILLAMYGATIGKLAILAETAVTNQAVCGCTPFEGVANRFLFLFLLSYRANFHAASEGGAQPNISKVKIVSTPFPLPPLAEQHRIVAKVDELMALCDQLEQARAGREAVRDRLTTASLARLTAPDTDAETFQSHARFALQSLPTLTTHPDQIKTLRHTILNLAVRGKLVEQDASDEPAAELLARAIAAKQSIRAERHIGRSEDPEFSRSACEPSLPDHWVSAYLADFGLVLGGKRLPAGTSFSAEPTDHIYIRVTDMKNGTILSDGLKYIAPDVQKQIAKYTIDRDDIYITIAGTIGDVGDVPENFHGHNLTENAAKIVFREIDREFLILVLRSQDVQDQFAEKTKQMAQPKLALKRILGARLPLPPLAEQHRIVAKVDALMALCDQLEASLTTTATTRSKLLNALLHEALEPAVTSVQEAAE